MGMSLQLRESLQELLYTDKYDTDDAELIVQRRFEKKEPFALNPRIENPLFRKILHLMHVDIDFAELRDCYFSADMGDGLVLVYPYKDTEYFLAIDLHRDRLEETDAVTFAVYCDARKYVKLKEYFELLWINSALDYKMPITEAPLIKSVLESDRKCIYYKGDRIPVADKKFMESIRRRPDSEQPEETLW